MGRRPWAALGVATALGACSATTPVLTIPAESAARVATAGEIASQNGLALNANITAMPLGSTETMSYQIVFIADRERPHLHARHDLAVTLLEGSGRMILDRDEIVMRAGDVAVIPRGRRHYFVNSGSKPAVAFVVSAPPFDPTDSQPLE